MYLDYKWQTYNALFMLSSMQQTYRLCSIDIMQMDMVDASSMGTTARSQLYVQGAG